MFSVLIYHRPNKIPGTSDIFQYSTGGSQVEFAGGCGIYSFDDVSIPTTTGIHCSLHKYHDGVSAAISTLFGGNWDHIAERGIFFYTSSFAVTSVNDGSRHCLLLSSHPSATSRVCDARMDVS